MPCWETWTITHADAIEYEAGKLRRAVAELGGSLLINSERDNNYTINLRGQRIQIDGTSAKARVRDSTNFDIDQAMRDVNRSYSREIVRETADTFGWDVEQNPENEWELELVRY